MTKIIAFIKKYWQAILAVLGVGIAITAEVDKNASNKTVDKVLDSTLTKQQTAIDSNIQTQQTQEKQIENKIDTTQSQEKVI